MTDKEIMENLLLTEKGACDLYLHGSIESSTPTVQEAFQTALNAALCMQGDIYRQMSDHGWYTTQQAPAQSIQQVHNKFATA